MTGGQAGQGSSTRPPTSATFSSALPRLPPPAPRTRFLPTPTRHDRRAAAASPSAAPRACRSTSPALHTGPSLEAAASPTSTDGEGERQRFGGVTMRRREAQRHIVAIHREAVEEKKGQQNEAEKTAARGRVVERPPAPRQPPHDTLQGTVGGSRAATGTPVGQKLPAMLLRCPPARGRAWAAGKNPAAPNCLPQSCREGTEPRGNGAPASKRCCSRAPTPLPLQHTQVAPLPITTLSQESRPDTVPCCQRPWRMHPWYGLSRGHLTSSRAKKRFSSAPPLPFAPN